MSLTPTHVDIAPRSSATVWSREFVLTWLSTWLIFLGFYLLLPTLPGYFLNELHGKQSQVGWIIGLFFAVYATILALSRPACGYVADKFGRHVVILPCMLLFALSMVGLAWESSVTGLVVVAIVYGIAMGGAGPALNALTIDRVPPEERGAAMGMYTAMFELGLAMGAIVLGFVLDHGGFTRMWLVSSVAPVLGFAFFAIGRKR